MPLNEIIAYADGQRQPPPADLSAAMPYIERPDGLAWVRLSEPTVDELREVAERLDLHDLVVDDLINAHQRSKIERYGNMVFVVLHAARYDEAREKLQISEIHALVGPNYVVTIRQTAFAGSQVIIDRLTADDSFARHPSLSVLHALMDTVVDEYRPIIAMIEEAVDAVQDELFDDAEDPSSQRIYGLLREVIILQRLARSLRNIAQELESGRIFRAGPGQRGAIKMPGADDPELALHWRDVVDHTIVASDRTDDFRQALENALTVHATLVAQEQNEEMKRMSEVSLHQAVIAKKVSAWAAIFFVPTLVAGIYGMNFDHMPELHWELGYPWALLLMAIGVGALFFLFRRSDWL